MTAFQSQASVLEAGMNDASSSEQEPAACQPGEQRASSGCVAEQIIDWQTNGSEAVLESLLRCVLPRLESVIQRVLRRRGIRDASAIDDTLSLVPDHLRRLPRREDGERDVARFAPRPAVAGGAARGDAGIAYLMQLAHSRAIDVARRRQRRATRVFSEIGSQDGIAFEATIIGDDPIGAASPNLRDSIAEAASRLEPRQRLVIELLLAGKSQAMIAHVLEVSEGTVSRLRLKAIESLRQILDS